MAGALVGGAFLSGFVNVVFDRLISPEFASLIRGKKLDNKLVQRLKITLCAVQAALNDAEQKQIKDPAVKEWLNTLTDAVYVADDLLDRICTEAATQKEVSNLFSRYLNLQDRKMVTEMEDIIEELESIVKHKDTLGLKEIAGENFSWRTPSTSLLGGSSVYGRDQDKEAIVKLLLDDNSYSKISVIPIVGMGGVGKTTLAQSVYNDHDVTQKFDLKAWVCVSEEFDIVKVTKTILETIASSAGDVKDLNLLQLDLKEKLSGKKFLIVLDDVWNDDYVHWNELQKPFQYGKMGSKILVTTRSKKVAWVFQTVPSYNLSQLSDEDCWLVFANHAFLSSESSGNLTLEKIGREIVRKCKGLPLAAKTLGGLLRFKNNINDWNTVLNSDIWGLPENESKIIPALKISYHYLPPHLKRCFVYCSLYPEDYKFDKNELILLWMAEDLLKPVKSGKTLEEVGCEYFEDLASRSFFQHPRTGSSNFVMHDLIHDLAISVAGEFYSRSEELGEANKINNWTRHLSYNKLSHPIMKNLESLGGVKSLRTFLPIELKDVPFSLENIASIVLSKYKCLRVLSFHSFPDLEALPHSIGELIHLRYLDLSDTRIKTLPESLTNLYNLQTLKLRWCSNLTTLPRDMQNLVNLRHLDIRGTGLEEMPRGMSKLKHLQFLSDFAVGKHEENGIKELGELSNLHGSLGIRRLENVANSEEALGAGIVNKKHINNLWLKWSLDDDDDIGTSSESERNILDKLQPHEGLQMLIIKGYRGTRFSDWVGHSCYHNMTELVLESCHNCYMLPSLGQLPSLQDLRIENLKMLGTIGVEFYKNDDDHSSSTTPFPSLEHLEFRNMPCLQVWCSSESDAFPKLKSLRIVDCPRLTEDLPNYLLALETLSIARCENLASSLPRAPSIRQLYIRESNKVALREFPLSLNSLSISGCEMVESVFKAISITQPTCLQSLEVRGCSSDISFPGDFIPASLKRLEIYDCRKLELPKQQQQHDLLESLEIRSSCDSLASFPLETFPNLEFLTFRKCANLESLSVSQSQHPALQSLTINDCPNFVSFPREGLVAPSMTDLYVIKCEKLKSLPSHMNTLLPKLESLRITDCPEIDSFPEGGLPPNLRILRISYCEKLLSSLPSMGMLEELGIYGACETVKSFPKEGLLPHLPSLTHLELSEISSMETLECKGLLHLTSLQQLTITECPKLENMEGERLPASLIKLSIEESPLLEERCQTKHPQIWPKISHIPGIQVNWRWVS